MTAYCIFAVDFKVFPRKLAKSEKFGYSYMDSGTGSIFALMGISAAYLPYNEKPIWNQFKSLLIHSIPIILLGTGRPFFIYYTNYTYSITEYGVHWNFFLTISVVSILGFFATKIFSNCLFFFSLIVLIIYELILKSGLQDFVFNTQRTNIITQNIEGIVQCIGYTICYILGNDFGNKVRDVQISTNNSSKKVLSFYLLNYAQNFGLYFFSIYILGSYPSRRLANFGYVFLNNICFSTTLFNYAIFYYLSVKPFFNSFILSVHNHKLLYFLSANVMVGLFNLKYDGYSFSISSSITILIIYFIIAFCIPRLYDFSTKTFMKPKARLLNSKMVEMVDISINYTN